MLIINLAVWQRLDILQKHSQQERSRHLSKSHWILAFVLSIWQEHPGNTASATVSILKQPGIWSAFQYSGFSATYTSPHPFTLPLSLKADRNIPVWLLEVLRNPHAIPRTRPWKRIWKTLFKRKRKNLPKQQALRAFPSFRRDGIF